MKSMKDQKTILIFALSAIALIMVVGFAAFSTNLTINGTANISTNWCVGFDNTKTDTYQITKGKSTGTTPTATMGYDGSACSSTYVPIANLGATFYQPGDKVEYTLTIANKGSIDAAIESITVDGNSVTSNQTITKGNIIWKVYMPASTTLQATTGTTTMVVSAEFQNKTDLVSYNAHETQTITVGINAVQNSGSNAMVTTATSFTGTIYRNNTTGVSVGDSLVSGPKQVLCLISKTNSETTYNGCEHDQYFYTQEECNDTVTSLGTLPEGTSVSCEETTVTKEARLNPSEYTTDASTLNKNVYLKHDVVNDIITASYVCFITDTEHCMIGRGIYYDTNRALLQTQESWFKSHSGSCEFGGNGSSCYGGEFGNVTADYQGDISINNSDGGCSIRSSVSSCNFR